MSRDKKTLVILTPGFPASEADTTCLPMQQQLVRQLQEIDPSLQIIVLSFQYPYFTKTYKWFGIPVKSFDGRNKGGLLRLWTRYKLHAALKKIYKQDQKMSLLSFWYGECAWVGHRFAKKKGLKHFCWVLGQDAKKENRYPGLIDLPAGELIALSDFIQDEFERNHGKRPQHLIAPGIEPGLYGNSTTTRDIDILGTGSMIPLKRFDHLIGIVNLLKKDHPGIKAVLIGEGPEKEKLKVLINTHQLVENITLAGELPYPAVLQMMQRSKLLIHPSSYEGFGTVCIEALFAGAHVISYVKPMKQDIQQWHIAGTTEEMAQQVSAILKNPSTIYKPVLFGTIKEVAQQMLELFYRDAS